MPEMLFLKHLSTKRPVAVAINEAMEITTSMLEIGRKNIAKAGNINALNFFFNNIQSTQKTSKTSKGNNILDLSRKVIDIVIRLTIGMYTTSKASSSCSIARKN
jgi:hypothetical protein